MFLKLRVSVRIFRKQVTTKYSYVISIITVTLLKGFTGADGLRSGHQNSTKLLMHIQTQLWLAPRCRTAFDSIWWPTTQHLFGTRRA